jgi:hypothetical protein
MTQPVKLRTKAYRGCKTGGSRNSLNSEAGAGKELRFCSKQCRYLSFHGRYRRRCRSYFGGEVGNGCHYCGECGGSGPDCLEVRHALQNCPRRRDYNSRLHCHGVRDDDGSGDYIRGCCSTINRTRSSDGDIACRGDEFSDGAGCCGGDLRVSGSELSARQSSCLRGCVAASAAILSSGRRDFTEDV